MPRNPALRAIPIALAGMAALSAMDATAKALTANMPAAEIVFWRFFGVTLWLGLFIAATRQSFGQTRYLPRHAGRAALMGLTAFLFFFSLSRLPLALATALAMAAPVYIAILGIVMLGERLTARVGGAVLLGLAGSGVIVFANGAHSWTMGTDLLALGAAALAPLTYASGVVLLKRHATDEPAASVTFAQSGFIALFALPFAATGFVVPNIAQWPLVGLIGLLGAVGYLLFVTGLKMIAASMFALVDYTSLLWAALLGYVFFAEVPAPALWIGGGMIIGACLLAMTGPSVETGPKT